jgi:putative (di)nucleoside polyphosphate hydrolase
MVHRPGNGSSNTVESGHRNRHGLRRRSDLRERRLPTAPLKPAEFTEPDLIMLLAEPEVQLLMRADLVDERELTELLSAISLQLRNSTDGRNSADDSTSSRRQDSRNDGYRAGVGIVMINPRNEVFVGRRADMYGDAWQMPQGGIDRDESPRTAALRELKEEIVTDAVEIIAESERWLYYDVPEALAHKAWFGRWRGQRQKWFVTLFKGRDKDINIATGQPEFNAWRWVPLTELSALAVSFKRQLYLNVLGEFPTIFRDKR